MANTNKQTSSTSVTATMARKASLWLAIVGVFVVHGHQQASSSRLVGARGQQHYNTASAHLDARQLVSQDSQEQQTSEPAQQDGPSERALLQILLARAAASASASAGDRYDDSWPRPARDASADTQFASQNDDPMLPRIRIDLLEDKDYPKLFEHYPDRVGQVSGITTLSQSGHVVILHRAGRHWTRDTFDDATNTIKPHANTSHTSRLIRNNTIMVLDGDDGSSLASFGSNLFYMPHSIASDATSANLWVSDVGRHQVMRLPIGRVLAEIAACREFNRAAAAASAQSHIDSDQNEPENEPETKTDTDADDATIKRTKPAARCDNLTDDIRPDLVLGEAFVPGNDERHFCKPAEIVVSKDGALVFVADGYCNRRIVAFTSSGKYVAEFGAEQNMQIVHSLALFERRDLLCAADRENGRILCFRAGLTARAPMGELVHTVYYPLGRLFAIATVSHTHLLVSSNQFNSSRYDLTILEPFERELKLVWTSSDLIEPHSLSCTRDGQHAYAADVSASAYKKVFKFDIIRQPLLDN